MTEPVNAPEDLDPTKRGFLIRNEYYPFPLQFKVSDPILVREVANLPWVPFVNAVLGTDDPDEQTAADQLEADEILPGLLAVAVWHQHPDWDRSAVARFVNGLDQHEVDVVGVSQPPAKEGDEQSPPEPASETTPTETPTGTASDGSPEESTPPPDSLSE